MKKSKKNRLERLHRRRVDRGKAPSNAEPEMTGTISIAAGGFGFVKVDDTNADSPEATKEVFIPPKYIDRAMNGDVVGIIIVPPRPDHPRDAAKGPCGRVVSIVKRKRDSIIGEVIAGHKVRPINRKLLDDIDIAGTRHGAQRGEWVELKLLDDGSSITGKVVRSLGKAGSIQVDLDAICAEFNLCAPYTDEQNARAAQLPRREIEREDLTGHYVVTIDPTDAKDFDDALSIGKSATKGAIDIGVHISDVASYIAPKGEFDTEAAKRGFTAYLPGRTLPMLPKELTRLISLQAGVKSAAHTVILTVDKKSGKVLSYRRFHSLIKVDRRLTYAEVQEYIDHPDNLPDGWDKTLAGEVGKLLEATRAMRHYRQENEKFIDLAMPEIRVMCDEAADTVSGLARKVQGESDYIVEECMLAANSAVGDELCNKGIPGLFRVHPVPDEDKLTDFSYNIETAFGFYPGDLTSREACNAFIAKIPDDERKPMILSLFLRSLPRAYYSEKPELHFGLGKTRYCHFTSPIRRYTDLTVHQQLWKFDTKQRLSPALSMTKRALELSALEENNDNAYFTASDRLKMRYLSEKLAAGAENFYEGVISKVTSAGLVVEVPDLGNAGFIPLDNLPGQFYRDGDIMRQQYGKKQYKLGDYIYLRLVDLDFVRSQAIFRPSGT